jgi:hypothetical protein
MRTALPGHVPDFAHLLHLPIVPYWQSVGFHPSRSGLGSVRSASARQTSTP